MTEMLETIETYGIYFLLGCVVATILVAFWNER